MTRARPARNTAAPHDQGRSLADLDTALIDLRRLWAAPARLNDPTLGTVEMSTIWIADALDRRADLPEVTVADLAAALDVAHSTASRLVDRAQAAGCVLRNPSATDSRRTALALTPTGRTLAQSARTARTGYLAAVTADWTPEERRSLADLLTRLATTVHSTPPHPDPEPTEGPTR
jgi:DNA-binding MarR family transcriptional regulator